MGAPKPPISGFTRGSGTYTQSPTSFSPNDRLTAVQNSGTSSATGQNSTAPAPDSTGGSGGTKNLSRNVTSSSKCNSTVVGKDSSQDKNVETPGSPAGFQ